ncbi:uncharacterized protein LOC141898939 [Tubulanus polymorphus]|uniref:uncharacterized protein LOC141898939 n=1 Tax=Tubulanus polymorphus TaxID=672921 RepID=UPI003DA3B6AA
MATAIGLPSFPEFDLQPRETAPIRFDKYIKRLENMFVAMAIDEATRQKAILLHYIGEPANDVYETRKISAVTPGDANRANEFKCAVLALKTHFEPQKCTDHLVYLFRKESQKPDESTAEFYTRLSTLASKCDFTDSTLEIKRQIIQGTLSSRLRRKAVEQGLTLNQLLNTARGMETADERTSEMEQHTLSAPMNKLRVKLPWKHATLNRPSQPNRNSSDTRICGLCGGVYPHQTQCPAKGQECHNCSKRNHFARKPNQSERNRNRDPSRNRDYNSRRQPYNRNRKQTR